MQIEKKYHLLVKKIILSLALVTLFSSCVGTVEDKDPKTTVTIDSGSGGIKIPFSGIISAKGISDKKIEVEFMSAYNGADDDVTYHIYVNNSTTPINVRKDSLASNNSGNYIYTLDNLSVNTTYSFKVGVSDIAGNEGLDEGFEEATTFSNKTCDFRGISAVTIPYGTAGKTSLQVSWVPAVSKGVSYDPDVGDPISYELRYISNSGGANNLFNNAYSGADKVILSGISASTTSIPVNSLTSGQKYYFAVRCVHHGYTLYGANPGYKKEENFKIISQKTPTDLGTFDFTASSVISTTPDGSDGKSNLDIEWERASGDLDHYRVFFTEVADDLVSDQLDIELIYSNPATYKLALANNNSYRLSNITNYSWMQIKVVACKTALCEDGARVISDLVITRAYPKIAPFQGITGIDNPKSNLTATTIHLNFFPPTMSAGDTTNFELYCVPDKTNAQLATSILMSPGVSVPAGNGACSGLNLNSLLPSTPAQMETFSQVDIQNVNTVTPTEYCFKLFPVIDLAGTTNDYRDYDNSSLKCIIPETTVPNNIEFVGKDSCTTSSSSITANWTQPNTGIFSEYMIFYKEKVDGESFSFDAAKTDTTNGNAQGPTYKYLTRPSGNDSAVISSLEPGNKYEVGVLTYVDLIDGGSTVRLFSEDNLNYSHCTTKLPNAKFQEWTQLYAIGPKINGLYPVGNDKRNIIETRKATGVPIEVDLNADEVTPVDSSLEALTLFDGVYGTKEADPVAVKYIYSNNGIIHLEWDDVILDLDGTPVPFDTFVRVTYPTICNLTPKPGRRCGYKVFRSQNNKATWVELTSKDYEFQTSLNEGLLLANELLLDNRPRLRSNSVPIDGVKRVTFTDYSVKASANSQDKERARVYFYKIIPYFDNKPLEYADATNPSHHIVKVTLPPANMALVHRKMSNRTICREMMLSTADTDPHALNKSSNGHYSCAFNGLGSSSITIPMRIGETVYDMGGDLLVDRFEMGCNFTRGRTEAANTPSVLTLTTHDQFAGDNDDGATYRGCFNKSPSADPSNAYNATNQPDYTSVVNGDCVSRDAIYMDNSANCADKDRIYNELYTFPGAQGDGGATFTGTNTTSGSALSCENPGESGPDYDYDHKAAQSEFAAVFYIRHDYNGNTSIRAPQNNFRGGNSKRITREQKYWRSVSSCFVNLPAVDSATNKWIPRWLPANLVMQGLVYDGNEFSKSQSLHSKTIDQLLAMPELYDTTQASAPLTSYIDPIDRFDRSSTSLVKIFSSNDSKLPVLTGFSTEQRNSICNSYEVEVGSTAFDGTYFKEKTFAKRLMRRKEFIASAAWPENYGENSGDNSSYSITSLEVGSGAGSCNSRDGVSSHVGGDSLYHNSPYTTVMSNYNSNGTGPGTHDPYWGGSSSLDNGAHSENCISRFGIQDLVGNMDEPLSDQVFCDYTQDKLLLGDAVGQNPASSVPIGSGQHYKLGIGEPWVYRLPSSGYCSVVQASGNRVGLNYVLGADFFNPVSSDSYASGYNESYIFRLKEFDQRSVATNRNGDGYFLDFGGVNLSPQLSSSNSLSLHSLTEAKALYFNPALGMPLLCGDSSCDLAEDNFKFVSESLHGLKSADYSASAAAKIKISDFPIGNSTITNIGIGEVNNPSDTTYSSLSSTPWDYVDTIDPLSQTKTTTQTIDGIVTQRLWWKVARGSALGMLSGGSSNGISGVAAGRYGMQITGSSPDVEARRFNIGTRCSVMINTD